MGKYDFINPKHYKNGPKEVWEMMIDVWGVERFISYCEMNAFKYRQRLGLKPEQPIQRDLDKAKWYESKAKELREIIKTKKNGTNLLQFRVYNLLVISTFRWSIFSRTSNKKNTG